MNEWPRNSSLVGLGTLLGLIVASLSLATLAGFAQDVAAPMLWQRDDLAGSSPSPAVQMVTTTVFLPLVSRGPTPNVWQAEYYPNPNLSGPPAYRTEERRVDYAWGTGAPSGLPRDLFSIRWTGWWNFEAGKYTFFVFADDGVRLWLDGQLLIDHWHTGGEDYYGTATVSTAGLHHLRLEYFEEYGSATIRLHWRRTDLYPQWYGKYYENPWVESPEKYRQTDDTIEFDWGEDSPAALPVDGFSISWSATPLFEVGTHRFSIYADDGYQLFIDGNKVKEGGWVDGQGGGGEDVWHDLTVNAIESHQITFNFHDRGSLAEARLWLQSLEQPKWTAEYYGNMNLHGSPLLTKQEAVLFYDWGFGRPYSALPADRFSARWTTQHYFHAGCYQFGLFADDGVRLWVDGELLVNQWQDGRTTYYSPVTYLDSGYHQVVVEYYENTGEAEIRLWWE